MKTKYTIKTKFGTFTRSSNSDRFTHLVIYSFGVHPEAIKERAGRDLEYNKGKLAELQAQMAAGIAGISKENRDWCKYCDVSHEDYLRDYVAKFIPDYEKDVADHEAKLKKDLADNADRLANPVYLDKCAKYCGREGLAEGEVRKLLKRGYVNVHVIEILPEHKREVKTRAKKEIATSRRPDSSTRSRS